MMPNPQAMPFLKPVIFRSKEAGIAITVYEMKKAKVTRYELVLSKLNACLKNVIRMLFTQVTNPKIKNNKPMMEI